MSDGARSHATLHIKKYPNRRFYDTTRSRHVTLQELHELVNQGHTVIVTDSRTGEDITNLILVQIILDKDPPKLHLFPSWVLHWMIRSKQSALRSMLDPFFAPFTSPLVQTQRQLDEMINRSMGGEIPTPMDWAQSMMRLFAGMSDGSANGRPDADPPAPTDTAPTERATLDELRRQVGLLNQRVAELQTGSDPPQPPPTTH